LDSADSVADINCTGWFLAARLSAHFHASDEYYPRWNAAVFTASKPSQFQNQGGYLMKQLLAAVAMTCAAAGGCANQQMLGFAGSGQASHVIRSQLAPRPEILRTAYHDSGFGSKPDLGAKLASWKLRDWKLPRWKLPGWKPARDSGSACGDTCNSECGMAESPSCGSSCDACDGAGCGLCRRVVGGVASGFCPHSGGYPEFYNYTPGPPVGQTAYPYYTVRGPRDFLQANPPSIGPY